MNRGCYGLWAGQWQLWKRDTLSPSPRRKPGPIDPRDAMRIRFGFSVGPGFRREDERGGALLVTHYSLFAISLLCSPVRKCLRATTGGAMRIYLLKTRAPLNCRQWLYERRR